MFSRSLRRFFSRRTAVSRRRAEGGYQRRSSLEGLERRELLAIVVDDDYTTGATPVEDTPFNGNVLTNDTGGTSPYVSRKPVNGSVTLQSTGAFTYTPAPNYHGMDAFTYTLTEVTERETSASTIQASARFGWATSIDGDTAIIAAPYEDNGASADVGAVYVFQWNGQNWVETQKIWGEAAGDLFGYDVAIHKGRFVAGAFLADPGGLADRGAAYVYEYDGTQWVQRQKLTASDGASSDWFGRAVALHGDTAVIGAPMDDLGVKTNAGSVYVFNFNGGVWSQATQLTASDGLAFDQFGISVSMDGQRIMVGANTDDDGATADTGSAYIFQNTSGAWTEQAKLLASDRATNDQFGWSVSISGDVAVAGAYLDDLDAARTDAGSAYIFKWSGSGWSQAQKVFASDALANDFFAFDVAVAGDTLAVGAYGDDMTVFNAGSVYVFRDDATTWTQRHKLVAASQVYGASNGYSAAAVWGDTVLAGIPSDTVSGITAGSASFFELLSGTVRLNVVPGTNDAPTLTTAIPDITGLTEDAQDSVIQLTNYFTDPDLTAGDTLTYSIISNSNTALVGTSFVGNALVLDYKDNQSGTATITVRATDSGGLFTSDTFAVTVAAVPDLPVISWFDDSPSVVRPGESLVLSAGGVSDAEQTIASVAFYRDINGNMVYDSLVDQLLGTDTSAPSGSIRSRSQER